ncbi:MAG: Fe-S cluster assembly protein SufD [Burkholderiales bacterium]
MAEPLTAYVADFARVAKRLPGPAWLRDTRSAALERFNTLGFPTTRHEDWKYTSVAALEKRAWKLADGDAEAVAPRMIEGLVFPELDCHLLVFINGSFQPDYSRINALPSGAVVSGLAGALECNADSIRVHLARYADYQDHAFVAFNTAFMGDGAYIALADNVTLLEPIHLLFITAGITQASLTHPRNLIVAGANSKATVIEHHVGFSEIDYLTNAVTEIVAAPGASIEHIKLQQENLKGSHIATVQVHQERDSTVISHSVSLGAMLARVDLNFELHAEGCTSTLNGLYVAGSRQHMDHHTRVDHLKPRCTSREYYKGVLDGRARGVFNGKVVVHQDAQQTDAHQVNNNLLLSGDAEVDTKPQLEIYADDVKCAHGSTVGQLDEEMVFYLRSRGIDQESARSLLTYAFANDVLERIRLEALRVRLEQVLIARLPQGQRVKEML